MSQVVVATLFIAHFTSAANILAIIPTASFSHQIPFRPLWKALASKGHNITLVTTDPMDNDNLDSIKQIDISYAYDHYNKRQIFELSNDKSKSVLEVAVAIRQANNETNVAFLQSPDGQNLIHNKHNRFDLLIVEAQLSSCMMIFSWWFQIPFIGISSFDCALQYHLTAGNLVHPAIIPDTNVALADIKTTTFWARFMSFTYMSVYRALLYLFTYPREQKMLQQFFGEAAPPLWEIQDNMSMLFVSTNPIFQAVRALRPNTITIGNGMHLGSGGQLPEDILRVLDKASEGAIYFSLGSSIMGQLLNDSTKNELVAAFSRMPYKFIWKIDYEFDEVPSNIIVRRWFSSQEAILEHPNVKIFMTQGGLQSMQESVYFGKPMIGIPFFGDQHMNIRRMVQLDYGIMVDKDNITQKSVTEAVMEVMNNPLYKEKAMEYSAIFKDVEMPDLDKAVWWTEYVIRHKGARHLRNRMLDMPFWKKNMLDVLGFLLVWIALWIVVLKRLVRLCRCGRRETVNVKQEKKVS